MCYTADKLNKVFIGIVIFIDSDILLLNYLIMIVPKYFLYNYELKLDGIVKQYFQNSFWEENKSATDALAKINFC